MPNALDYKKLKSIIMKSAKKVGKTGSAFTIDIAKLTDFARDLNLIPLPVGQESKKVATINIPAISEYFIGQKLSWFDEDKQITFLTFVSFNEDTKEELNALLEQLNTSEVDDPDLDHVDIVSDIVAKYPCYFACVVSYKSNNPNYIDTNSYIIACRANKVIIRDPNYVYNPQDMA